VDAITSILGAVRKHNYLPTPLTVSQLFWCSQSTTVLFRSIRLYQVLSEPGRRSINTSSRNNSM